jgi:hypothetical protein
MTTSKVLGEVGKNKNVLYDVKISKHSDIIGGGRSAGGLAYFS